MEEDPYSKVATEEDPFGKIASEEMTHSAKARQSSRIAGRPQRRKMRTASSWWRKMASCGAEEDGKVQQVETARLQTGNTY